MPRTRAKFDRIRRMKTGEGRRQDEMCAPGGWRGGGSDAASLWKTRKIEVPLLSS